VVSLVISVVSKTGLGIFLAHLVFLKSEKSGMPENFQVHLNDCSDPELLKASKKPRILLILGNILLHLSGVTQLGHFQGSGKIQ
jgi:hypothetical protein